MKQNTEFSGNIVVSAERIPTTEVVVVTPPERCLRGKRLVHAYRLRYEKMGKQGKPVEECMHYFYSGWKRYADHVKACPACADYQVRRFSL